MHKSYQILTRDEYAKRISLGQTFRSAGLYEPDHASKETEFLFVIITSKQKELKRRLT